MKLMKLALTVVLAAITSTSTVASTASSQHLFCALGLNSLDLTCWNSNEEKVYTAVPFQQPFDEGWVLLQAYYARDSHYWVLQRKQPAEG